MTESERRSPLGGAAREGAGENSGAGNDLYFDQEGGRKGVDICYN